MKVSQIGQFGLIDKIARLIQDAHQPQAESWENLRMGVGDDCAVWQGERTCYLSKVDSQVEGVHFTLDTISWRDLGWKALAVNLSDIAAMGGQSLYALVSLGLPIDTEVEDIMQLYRGLIALAGLTGTAVIGGHISASKNVFIDVQVTGRTASPEGSVLSRSAAHAGDLLAVTGFLGSAAAGLKMLKKKMVLEPAVFNYLQAAFSRPQPRLAEGKLLLESGVSCAIDISDGLVADLSHICHASGVAAEIETLKLPISMEVKSALVENALDLAMSGGEDYQLLFTAPWEVVEAVKTACSYPITVIGKVTSGPAGQITLIEKSGKRSNPISAGWDHFKKN